MKYLGSLQPTTSHPAAIYHQTHRQPPFFNKQLPIMPGVSVRDVDAQKFIDAYAAFLKRQGKLQIPGMYHRKKTSQFTRSQGQLLIKIHRLG